MLVCCIRNINLTEPSGYSHSMVAGGLEVMS